MIGAVQPVGALCGLVVMEFSQTIVPYTMALAGGTLLFVIVNEILPETYDAKKKYMPAFALFVGFIAMTYLTMILE